VLQLLDRPRDVVHIDEGDALETPGTGAAELGDPIFVRPKDR
jgi:hypothetical protein